MRETETVEQVQDDESAEGMPAELVVIEGSSVKHHPLPASGTVILGRGQAATLRIDDASMSRRHTALHLGAEWMIEDLGSANGTLVSGQKLASGERVRVRPGEPIEMGQTLCLLRTLVPKTAEETPGDASVSPMDAVLRLVERLAQGSISILLLGETGVGKDVLASRIHALSPRASRPYLRLNCASFNEALLESELFGHERGAFTGADRAKPGLLEEAEGGTVLLDEVGELPTGLQAKLLRVFEEREVRRVGALKGRVIDVRFLAATNRAIKERIAQGHFRADLYYRLSGFTLVVPPLRERRAEILPLARTFVTEAARKLGPSTPSPLSAEACAVLERHSWPGNVRELKNVVERAVLLADGQEIHVEHLHVEGVQGAEHPPPNLASGERERIVAALEQCHGNQTRAATLLGISRRTLVKKLDRLGLPRPRKR